VMGTAAVALAFGLVFNTDDGPLNALLGVFGIGPIPWMTSPDWTKSTVIIFNIWQITGFWMLILLAGLQGIDRALHEAAMIDGANAIQRTWHVTIPGLAPLLAFAFIISTNPLMLPAVAWASATAASLALGTNKQYMSCSAVSTSPLWSPSDDPAVDAASPDMVTLVSSGSDSSTTTAVMILVVEAIGRRALALRE